MTYFATENAAARYDMYRPKVHNTVLDWLSECLGEIRYRKAIDVACGTGDSTSPLTRISDSVLGIDSSEAMLKYARDKNLEVQNLSYNELKQVNEFDLISTCMAFHWFDPEEALQVFKTISTEGAIWVIYNFYFGGHETSKQFNRWLVKDYLTSYPSPPRNKSNYVVPKDDPELTLLKQQKGVIQLDFSDEELVGYLTTQSNIEHAVAQGKSYAEVSSELERQVSQLNTEGYFRYNFTYEIFRFENN